MIIGLVQAKPGMGEMEYFVKEAKKKGCQVLCFPEAFLTGYVPAKVQECAIFAAGPEILQVSEWAQNYGMDILAGFMERDQDKFYLTQGIFRADGQIAFHRKTHLGQKELGIFTPGEELNVYPLSDGSRVGVQICMENHFPEITITYSLKGAKIVFAPFAVPGTSKKRKEVWSKIMPARSYDNRVYMACCNLWDGERFGGGCMASDPNGEILVENFDNVPGMVTFEYDEMQVRKYHEGNLSMKYRYYPEKRRPELYQM